uniref:hypothetical protein n=1 Tax=Alloprevotella sp. TaxID=1872471 RepID=UPI003FEFE4B6
MKKRYISPTSQVVLLDMQQMLALSPGSGVDGSVTAPGDSQLSREYEGFGASEYWDTSED